MMKKQFFFLLSLLLVTLIISSALQAQTSIELSTPTLNRSVRALGMGNAFIAAEGNEYSPFYNPAGLNDFGKWRLKLFSPTAEFSLGGIGLIKDSLDLKDNLNSASTDADKIRVLDSFVQKNIGSFQYVRYQMDIVSFTMKNFAAGMMIDERMVFSFRDQSFTNFDAFNTADAVFYIAGSYGFWEKLLQVGLTLRPTVRFAMNDKITYSSIIGSSAVSFEDRLKSIYKDYKFGFAADLGLQSNLDLPFLENHENYQNFLKNFNPRLALTWQDIGNPFPDRKTISSGQTIGFVENKQSVNMGFSISPDFGWAKSTFEIDMRKLNRTGGFMTKFHVGAELRFKYVLSIRTGFNQGRITGGASVDLKYFRLDFATYAEETGNFGSRLGDRRLAASINFMI